MVKITEEAAIELLHKYSDSEEHFKKVLRHVKAVQKEAVGIASKVKGIDMHKINIGSLLHDIGRFSCPPGKDTVKHGLIGCEILRKEGLPEIAEIAERHLGAGISKEEIIEQGLDLPLKDFVPVTKEEKIIAHADNLVSGDRKISKQEAIDRYEKELGKKVADKIRKLANEVENMR